MRYSVGVVGGGAAGMMAAIAAARSGAKVTLLEGNDRLGRKILSTGNGKCNLGNEDMGVEAYYTNRPDFLRSCLQKFGTEELLSFFQGIGLMVKSRNGYLYPACEQASAVLDVLRYEVRDVGVRVVLNCKVEEVEKDSGTGSIRVRGNGMSFSFDRVILACGGRAVPKTGSDGSGFGLARGLGHRLVPTVPALVPLRCREDCFKAVAGVRADACLRVFRQGKCVAQERGELQLTDYGISGIPVFQLSRVVNYILQGNAAKENTAREGTAKKNVTKENMAKESAAEKDITKENTAKEGMTKEDGKRRGEEGVEVAIDFLPDYGEKDLRNLSLGRKLLRTQRTVEEYFTGMLNKKLMLLFIRLAGLKPSEAADTADGEKINRVYELCRGWRVHVTGSKSYDNAQVCAGGVPLNEVTESLESVRVSGVYFAGELLDVDGKCGGYNLHWAWCSGYIAGSAAAE